MDEKQLIRDVDPIFEVFAELYRTNITRVYRYHMVHVGDANIAEDLTSQTFMAAWKEFPSLQKRGSFLVRVLQLAIEKCHKDHRWSRQELLDDAVLYYQVSSLPANKAAMQRMEIESISRTLKQIPSTETEAIILYFFCDLTNSESSAVLKKSTETIETLISRGLKNLNASTSQTSGMETITSDLEEDALLNKLSNVAAQIRPDPFFESELEQSLAASHQPKTKWTLPLQEFSTMIGLAALIGLTFFLIHWRVDPEASTTPQVTARPPTQDVNKSGTIPITATPRRPTARPTATDIPLQEYVVQAGDTCTYIADKFSVTIDLLITLNRLNSTCDIWAEQTLKVPLTPISVPASE
jgi:RNA polymerase sigma-70 factor (ECF subfamily)